MSHVVVLPRVLTREMWAAAGDAVVDLQARGIGNHDKITEAVFEALVKAAPPRHAPTIHDQAARRIVADMWDVVGCRTTDLNVLAESLLLGVGMLNFPSAPRKQAQIIQAIADGAQDRAKAVR